MYIIYLLSFFFIILSNCGLALSSETKSTNCPYSANELLKLGINTLSGLSSPLSSNSSSSFLFLPYFLQII